MEEDIFYHLRKFQVVLSFYYWLVIFFQNGNKISPQFLKKIITSTLIARKIWNFANNSN